MTFGIEGDYNHTPCYDVRIRFLNKKKRSVSNSVAPKVGEVSRGKSEGSPDDDRDEEYNFYRQLFLFS